MHLMTVYRSIHDQCRSAASLLVTIVNTGWLLLIDDVISAIVIDTLLAALAVSQATFRVGVTSTLSKGAELAQPCHQSTDTVSACPVLRRCLIIS